MMSFVHDDESKEAEAESEAASEKQQQDMFKQLLGDWRFGTRKQAELHIDTSLRKLFECMTLAYSGKLTSPKWKNFNGIKVNTWMKVRLNNIIWREWYKQYIYGMRPMVCNFETPISEKAHLKAEAVVLEGKYWKKKLEAVTTEYQKWRMYYREVLGKKTSQEKALMDEVLSHAELLERVAQVPVFPVSANLAYDTNSILMDFDDEMNLLDLPLTDNLQTFFSQPFPFANRELSSMEHLFIQPGLSQLQPSLDDEFMDTLEPLAALQEWLGGGMLDNSQSGSSMGNSLSVFQNYFGNSRGGSPTLSMSSSAASLSAPAASTFSQKSSSRSASAASLARPPPEPAPVSGSMEAGNPLSVYLQQFGANDTQQQQQQAELTRYVPNTDNVQSFLQQPMITAASLQMPLAGAATVNLLIGSTGNQSQQSITVPNYQNSVIQTVVQDASQLFALLQQQQQSQQVQLQQPLYQQTQAHSQLVNANNSFLLPTSQLTFQTINSSNVTFVPVMPHEQVKDKTRHLSGMSVTSHMSAPSKLMQEQKIHEEAGRRASTGSLWPRILPATAASKQQQQASATNKRVDFIIPQAGDVPKSSRTVRSHSTVEKSVSPPTPHIQSLGQSSTSLSPSAPSTGSPLGLRPDPSKLSASPPMPITGNALSPPSVPRDASHVSSLSPAAGAASGAEKSQRKIVVHLTAEQKRRSNIKSGFETLQKLIPGPHQGHGVKVSKAAILSKGVDYLRALKTDKARLDQEADGLRQEMDRLNNAISLCQSQLPASGAPVPRPRNDHMRQMFDNYVRQRTMQNWKFWIFSSLLKHLLDSYSDAVTTSNTDEFWSTVFSWLEQHCSLVALRRDVTSSLRQLTRSTSILSDASRLPQEAMRAVSRRPLAPSSDAQ